MSCENCPITSLNIRVAYKLWICAGLLLVLRAVPALSNDTTTNTSTAAEPLSFEFIKNPPGELHFIGTHRLHINCRLTTTVDSEPDAPADNHTSINSEAHNNGVTVLFEAGLGGSALEWQAVVDNLPAGLTACTYDRTGYGWSDPFGTPRDVRHLAFEIDKLLQHADISGQLLLVGHSFGGFVMRMLAERRSDVAGLVFVDTSHEQQFSRMQGHANAAMLPTRSQFIIRSNDVPENLPADIKAQVRAFGRMRKTYAATHGEMSRFGESAQQVAKARERNPVPFNVPIVVIRRGKELYNDDTDGLAKNAIWVELQEDLTKLSTHSKMVVAENSGHHVHVDQPELVAEQLKLLIDELP